MAVMTTRERMLRMYEHRDADRIPITDSPWNGTIARWHREGMPEGIDWRDYFDIDKVEAIGIDISPQFQGKTIEETDRYIIYTSGWGVTMKQFKELDSTPEFLDYKVCNPDEWEKAKALMGVRRDRINWQYLEDNFQKWRADGRWIHGNFWFGYDAVHSWMSGMENILIGMMEEPEWIKDMFNTYLESSIAHFDMIWDAGYHFDEIFWCDDMGYKDRSFFSNETYREMIQPFQKRAVGWAHSHGIPARLHSCGNIMSLLPDILETGIDALNPIEVKAGMDPILIKKTYGDRLVLHGGVNAVLWDHKDEIVENIEQTIPILKENGGYIFSSDHSIPNSVTLENMKAIVETVKRVGRY